MKASTLSAHEKLAVALDLIEQADLALKLTREIHGQNWLLMESRNKVRVARNAVEVAGGHVEELLATEDVL